MDCKYTAFSLNLASFATFFLEIKYILTPMLFQTDNSQGSVQTVWKYAIDNQMVCPDQTEQREGNQAVRPERAMKHLAQGRATIGAAPWVSKTEQTITPCKGKTIHIERNGEILAMDKKGFALTGRACPLYSNTQGDALGYEVLPFQGVAAEASWSQYIYYFLFQ